MTENLRAAFARTILETAKTDHDLIVMVGDISHGIFKPFASLFPDRYYNIGILEPAMMSIAAGLSKVGLNPVVHTIAPFLIERSFEQIKLDFGYQKLSANLVSVGGTFDYSQLGVSHHSYSDVALVSEIPGSKIFLPGSVEELEMLFLENYRSPGVKYYRLTENRHGVRLELPNPLGNKGVVVRPGTEITLATTGSMLMECVRSAEALSASYDIEILYFPVLKPLDVALIRESVSRTRRYLVVDELSYSGGLEQLVLNATKDLEVLSRRGLGVREMVHAYGTIGELRLEAGISGPDIERALRASFNQDDGNSLGLPARSQPES